MCGGIIYYKDKIFFTPIDNDYEAYEEVKQVFGLDGEIEYDEDTLEAKLDGVPIEYCYVDEFTQIS